MKPEIKKYLSEIGKRGGASKSPAKAEAVRANGRRGGRPNWSLEIMKRLRGSHRSYEAGGVIKGRKAFPPDVRSAIARLADLATERHNGQRDDDAARDACRAFDAAMRAAEMTLHDAGGPLRA